MWALGITMFQIITGEHPFNLDHEETFRKEAFNGWVDFSRLAGHPRLQLIIQNLLKVDPMQRWDANLVLVHAQIDFIVDIQRLFRGFRARKFVHRIKSGLVKLQAHIKGKLTRNRYRNVKEMRHDQAAIRIQSRWRAYRCQRDYRRKYHAIQKLQANILSRNYHRCFKDMKKKTQVAQAFIKRFLAMLWYRRIRESKDNLESHVENINQMIERYNENASQFRQQFPKAEPTQAFNHLSTFETYEMQKLAQG